ncbi:MAG: hypothetical protein MUC73_07615 [Cyclobacteriaceae bacterium]|jgi:hypothetical protein|nr:hypothetical protein [Cyclobacteriaceae bacterium]
MMTGKHLTFLLILTISFFIAEAQQEGRDMSAVTYEEIYDEPYAINKLFLAFQPLYGELFATNVNAGFGMEAHYYLADILDFKAQFRKTYTRGFYDMNRELANRVSDVDNDMEIFNYYEFGATYHIRDFEKNGKTKMLLYKSSFTKNEWAAGVPLYSDIPCKVRNIYGIRLGGIFWDSSVDINRALEAQDLSSDVLKNSEGNSIPADQNLFSNINSGGLYLGGSMTWIRNVAVSFDKYEPGVDDLILTVFLDLMYAPSVQVDDIVYTPKDANGVSIIEQRRTYSVSPIKTNSFGVRAGIEGKFNRSFSWSYGGEIGLRPSIQGQSVYAVIKIGIPVFGTNLNYKVEAFGK